ncbi:MAG: hypothetical protein JWQ83_1470, partial [Lacunisphaera sp.]|nr:hypothetical protein [Lacunisphaera sp.]
REIVFEGNARHVGSTNPVKSPVSQAGFAPELPPGRRNYLF